MNSLESKYMTLSTEEMATVVGGDRGYCADLVRAGFHYANCGSGYGGRPRTGHDTSAADAIGNFDHGFINGFLGG